MYLGGTPIEIDFATAMYILRQKENMPQGIAWGNSFPAVVNHTSSFVARRHPDFHAAKHGDFDAALRLVNDLVRDDKVAYIKERFPNAHVVYNHKIQGDGINMIPAAYAAKFKAAGMTVDHDIIAITNASHTNASDISRLSKRVRFEGDVCKGKDYILLDDFITSGAELRDLKDYIESEGGSVVMMTTFGHGSYGKLNDIRIDNDYKERLRALGITDKDLRKYGIAENIGCLTIGEAAKLSRVVNSRAKTTVAQLCARVQRTHQGESPVSGMGQQAQISRFQGVETQNENLTEASKTEKSNEEIRVAKGSFRR